jgi:hypothetical protein
MGKKCIQKFGGETNQLEKGMECINLAQEREEWGVFIIKFRVL